MDKKEYKIRLDEIMTLIASNKFEAAVEIADRIDWREIKSFGTLEKISNLYKVNRRYEHALEIAELAYSYNHVNSNIVYSMCELCIELNNLVHALEYLAIYKDLAPSNPASLILEYKIKELGNATLEEKIDILEEYKHKDPKQEWMYQLAYLYHRVGLATKCVETCDELITMMGDGPFVIKAMELKMLHTPLSKRQQAIYDARNNIQEEIEAVESDEYTAETPEPGAMPELGDEDFHVKTIDMGKFNTMNLQKALADSMRELLGEEENAANKDSRITRKLMNSMQDTGSDPFLATDKILAGGYEVEELAEEPEEYYEDEEYSEEYNEEYNEEEYSEEYDDADGYDEEYDENYSEEEYSDDQYEEENYSNGEYSEDVTDEYNDEYADEYSENYTEDGEEVFFDDKTGDIIIEQAPLGMVEDIIPEKNSRKSKTISSDMSDDEAIKLVAAALNKATGNTGKIKISDIPTGATGKIRNADIVSGSTGKIKTSDVVSGATGRVKTSDVTSGATGRIKALNDAPSKPVIRTVLRSEVEKMQAEENKIENKVKEEIKKDSYYNSYSRKGPFDEVLSQETDGQISLAIPNENTGFEKQITGQMNFQDFLSGWEGIKEERKKKQQEDTNNKILESTGKIFENYDHDIKNGILEQLEEEDKQAKKLISKDLELHRIEEFRSENMIDAEEPEDNTGDNSLEDEPFSATRELNKTYKSELWDELDKEMAKDKAGDIVSDVAENIAEDLIEGSVEAGVAAAGVMAAGTAVGVAAAGAVENLAEGTAEAIAEGAAEGMIKAAVDSAVTETATEENIKAADGEATDKEATDKEDISNDNSENYEDENGDYIEDGDYDEYYDEFGYYDENGEFHEYEYDEYGYYDEYGEYHEFEDEYYEDGQEQAEDYSEIEAENKADNENDNEAGNEENLPENNSEENPEEALEDTEESESPAQEENIENNENAGDEKPSSEDEGAELDTAQINDIGSVLEASADKVTQDVVEEINDEYNPEEERDFSTSEQELFADFMYSKKMRNQILEAVDLVSLASYVGNVIITGDEGKVTIELAKALIKEVQLIDANFVSQKVAKISGSKMNTKDVSNLLSQLSNGALIIERAGEMRRDALENITKALENSQDGIIIILTDTKKAIEKMIGKYNMIDRYFNARVDIVPMTNNALVEYAKKYAYSKEYRIDEETAVLALHRKIGERQIGDHHVTTKEIEEIVDNAIEKSRKLRISTLFNIVAGKRYDEEDMIVLREKDFT